MRIGFTATVTQKGKSGLGTYVHEIIRELTHRSTLPHDFEIFAFKQDIPARTGAVKFTQVSDIFEKNLLDIAWHNSKFRFDSRRLDILHIPTPARARFRSSIKTVVTVHDLAPFRMHRKYGRLRDIYNRSIVPILNSHTTHFICVSKNTRKDLIEFLKVPEAKTSVIYSGVDHSNYHVLSESEVGEGLKKFGLKKNGYIFYASRIEHPGKNHLALVKAYEKLLASGATEQVLVFAGALWNGAEVVVDYVEKMKSPEKVRRLGFISKSDLNVLYNGASFCVFPSLYEGFGFPLLEAMAAGSKCCCANNSSYKELGLDYVDYFDPYSESELSAALARGLNNIHSPINQSAVKYSQQFTWKKCIDEMIRLYENV